MNDHIDPIAFGLDRQSDTDPASKSSLSDPATHHYPSGKAAGTGANRTAARWKGSILIRRELMAVASIA
jgi:hypothetical protein